jgi:hypothetical protein
LPLEVAGAVVVVFDAVLDGALVCTDGDGAAGGEGTVVVVCSDVFGAVSFFSVVGGVGASLSEEGFIFSE